MVPHIVGLSGLLKLLALNLAMLDLYSQRQAC